MTTVHKTAGSLIRALMPYYNYSGYDLNIAVAEVKRKRGSGNWMDAALELLEEKESSTNRKEK